MELPGDIVECHLSYYNLSQLSHCHRGVVTVPKSGLVDH